MNRIISLLAALLLCVAPAWAGVSIDIAPTSTPGNTTPVYAGAIAVNEALGTEHLTLTCAGVGLAAPVGAWSCSGDTITRTASGSNLTLAIGSTVTTGTLYKGTVTYATITASTFKLTVGGSAQVTHAAAGAFAEYFPAGTTGAPTITVTATSAGTITLSALSVKPVLSGITGAGANGSTMASDTANESAVSIVGKVTGAGGDKTVLRTEVIGGGSGVEYIQEWYADGVLKASISSSGAVVFGGGTITSTSAGALAVTQTLSGGIMAGITASTTSVQGGSPLTRTFNEISACDNAGDSVTLVSAAGGVFQIITNHGVNSVDVFPASGDAINEATVDTAKALAADATMLCYAYSASAWECLTLAR